MYVQDTIVAIATPPGEGGIGIVRVSGPKAAAIANEIFVPQRTDAAPTTHLLRHGVVCDSAGATLDEALAVIMYGPHSYTGEDVLELHCHGSPTLLRAVVDRCLQCGARVAAPGEFTKRAFLNGRIDLVQAEAVAELISARSETAARVGLRHLSGALSEELASLRAALIGAKAHTEVLIDFADEEIDLDPRTLLGDLESVASRVAALLASFRFGRLLRAGMEVVLLGRPNVGKSSLLNALLGTDRAIVTARPGTTRDLIVESVQIDGIPVVLTDTAGLRTEPDEIEELGIKRTRQRAKEADALLVVLDRSEPLTAEDELVLADIGERPALIVANKSDLAPAWTANDLPRRRAVPLVETSALTSQGLACLRAGIRKLADAPEVDVHAPILTLARHRDALERTAEAVHLASESVQAGAPADLVAVDIQAAVEHIGGITGEVTTDEILDRIFREFCLGK